LNDVNKEMRRDSPVTATWYAIKPRRGRGSWRKIKIYKFHRSKILDAMQSFKQNQIGVNRIAESLMPASGHGEVLRKDKKRKEERRKEDECA